MNTTTQDAVSLMAVDFTRITELVIEELDMVGGGTPVVNAL
jgi:hypothetical protein